MENQVKLSCFSPLSVHLEILLQLFWRLLDIISPDSAEKRHLKLKLDVCTVTLREHWLDKRSKLRTRDSSFNSIVLISSCVLCLSMCCGCWDLFSRSCPQVMLAASYWSLLAPAIEMAEESGKYGDFAFFPVAVGFALGALFVYIADVMMPVLVSRTVIYNMRYKQSLIKYPKSAIKFISHVINRKCSQKSLSMNLNGLV